MTSENSNSTPTRRGAISMPLPAPGTRDYWEMQEQRVHPASELSRRKAEFLKPARRSSKDVSPLEGSLEVEQPQRAKVGRGGRMILQKLAQLWPKRNARKPTIVVKTRDASFFAKLPMEVWLIITKDFSLAHMATLSLTTRTMMHRFSFVWDALDDYRLAKAAFLMLLDRDLPHLRLCSRCYRFHDRQKKHDCRERKLLLLPKAGFAWQEIHEVMRAAAYGDLAYGKAIGSLTRRCSIGDEYVRMKAKISQGRLLIKVSIRMMVTGDGFGRLDTGGICEMQFSEYLPLCRTVAPGESACRATSHLAYANECWWDAHCIPRLVLIDRPGQWDDYMCNTCSSFYRIKTVKTWRNGGEDFLKIDRFIDAGAIAWAVSPEYFMGRCYPGYYEAGAIKNAVPCHEWAPNIFRRFDAHITVRQDWRRAWLYDLGEELSKFPYFRELYENRRRRRPIRSGF